jgi:hypothetical protein
VQAETNSDAVVDPDAVPDILEAPSGPCDPYKQTGCGPGEACDRTCDGFKCRKAGINGSGGMCMVIGDGYCAAGLTCVKSEQTNGSYKYFCEKLCGSVNDCAGRPCNPVWCDWNRTGSTVTGICGL